MDKQQFATISIGIKSAYPASKILEDKASMDFWYMMLRDIPYEVAENAVMEHICTNVFPPEHSGDPEAVHGAVQTAGAEL